MRNHCSLARSREPWKIVLGLELVEPRERMYWDIGTPGVRWMADRAAY